MGREFGLFHHESKTYIWLGKRIDDRFQIDKEKVPSGIPLTDKERARLLTAEERSLLYNNGQGLCFPFSPERVL